MKVGLSALCAVFAATAFALSAVGQQRAASRLPDSTSLRPRLLVRLLRVRVFVLSTGSMLAGYALQATALGFGSVALVEPIIVCELLVAVPLAIWLRGARPTPKELLPALGVAGGVAAFLVAASPTAGTHQPGPLTWVLALGACAGAIAGCVLVARGPSGARRGVLLGAAAGLSNAVVAVITKAALEAWHLGALSLLASWMPWMLLVAGVGGFLLAQSAYQAAPLADALPAIDSVDPAASVILAVAVLGEGVSTTAPRLVVGTIGLAAAVAGVLLLARSPLVRCIYERQRTEQRSGELADRTLERAA